jgi:lactate racemase
MKVNLAYGRTGMMVDLPDERTAVVEPIYVKGLPDERRALEDSLRNPIGSPPLRDLVQPHNTVAIVFCDITRPIPSDRILPVILDEIDHVPVENIVLICATGMHRPNTKEELSDMIGREVVEKYRVINHDGFDKNTLTYFGEASNGAPIWICTEYLQADVKILTGFIEPHLFAGFSGGPKLVLPGVSGEDTVMRAHGPHMVSHPNSTWGLIDGNPVHSMIREVAAKTNPTFSVNVTLNRQREITNVFSGNVFESHQLGTEFVRRTAMRPVDKPFDIVITTNSGYPLDINLYQTVKGVSAAARIVKQGGAIIAVSECSEGIPEHGNYKKIVHMGTCPQDLLDLVYSDDFELYDQWEAQLQALLQLKARIFIKSGCLSDEEITGMLYTPCHSVEDLVSDLLAEYGPEARIAVLPEGPQTIPYLAE